MVNFSVVVPVYNVAPYLTKFLNSLINQNYKDYEIILVNDGSTDKSLEICKKYELEFPNIVVISQENQGAGLARNAGMRVAKGEYIYFCDPDDYLSEGFFKHAEKYVKEKPELVIFSYWDVQKRNEQIIRKKLIRIEKDKHLNRTEFRKEFIELFRGNLLYTLWNKLYRKDFLNSIEMEFTDTPLGEDTRFNLQLYPFVSDLQLVEAPFYHYISNREESLTRKYRENRVRLQLGEIELLENVLKQFSLKDENMLRSLRLKILLGNSNHIANSNISVRKKRTALKRILKIDIFKEILEEYEGTRNLSFRLLKTKQIDLYLLLKHVQQKMIKSI